MYGLETIEKLNNEVIIKSNNPEFKVIWNCQKQRYTVYKNDKFLRVAFKLSDVKSYL